MSTTAIFSALALITLGLGLYALSLHRAIKRRNDAKQKQQHAADLAQQKARAEHMQSVKILLNALLQDELSYTEAAIRISALLTMAGTSAEEKQHYSSFFQLADKTAHIPILSGWKALSPKKQMEFDKQRLAIEEDFKAPMRAQAMKLLDVKARSENLYYQVH